MNMETIRKQSLETAASLGYDVNPSLPLLDQPSLRSGDEIFDRMMCMSALAACAYGFTRTRAIEWLQGENVEHALTTSEQKFLLGVGGESNVYIEYIEGIWTLAWVLNIVGDLDFTATCHPQFVTLMPDLRDKGSSGELRRRIRVRSVEHIASKLDLAYCLHWAIHESELRQTRAVGKMYPYVIIERRRALEWCLSEYDWDEVNMDT